MTQSVVVFFDLGDTLVSADVSATGVFLGVTVFPFVLEAMDRLKQLAVEPATIRFGAISNTTPEIVDTLRTCLQQNGLLDRFDPDLVLFSSVEGVNKSQTEIFARAAQRANMPPACCLFVGEDAAERDVAAQAQFQTSFHILHAFHIVQRMLDGG